MEATTPLIQVSHLPSAASFFGSLTQSLGLQFLFAEPVTPACLHFGYVLSTSSGPRKISVFTVSQATHPRLSHITLSAPNPRSVLDFHVKSKLLNQDRRGENQYDKVSDEEERALTRDFDGNIIEAVYSPPRPPIEMDKESKRVLEWQQDVARSIVASEAPEPPLFKRADTFPSDFGRERPLRLVRRETVTTEHYQPRDSSSGGGGGISGKAVIGTLLGAAAGAAFAYAMVRSESPPNAAPSARRPQGEWGHEVPIRLVDREVVPARSDVSDRERVRPRYVRYTVVAPPQSRILGSELGRIEERSHVSSHRSERTRERGAVGKEYERPLTILPAPERKGNSASHVSHVSHRSRHSGSGSGSGVERDRERERERERVEDRQSSYASARSHHSSTSSATIKLPPVPQPPSAAGRSTTTIRISPLREREGSYVSERRSVVSARQVPLPQSVVSARQVPLPRSTVGGSNYAASVAPSDSVSSVGSKRERERLRERMGSRAGNW